MDELITSIINYSEYLKTGCGLRASIHFGKDIFDRMSDDTVSHILPYNSHTNAYCIAVKSTEYRKCLFNQSELLKKCRNVKPFCNICHAGVYEYIHPIFMDGCAVGFVAVSGYRLKESSGITLKNRELWESSLNTELPLDLCTAVISPLCIMLERMLTVCLREERDEYRLILQYLNEYHTNVTLSDLAKYFGRSKSYISHLFKTKNGMTLRAYCNRLKLKDAQRLLLSTDCAVTEIALEVGFNDTSYFIYLFKKEFEISPLQYRLESRKSD